jgi:hypothetical protein
MAMRLIVLFVYSFLFSGCLSGCATAFMGSAHVEGGRKGCDTKCASQGFKCTGMVYMGEYSSACICETPESTRAVGGAGGAAAGSASGVMMQMYAQQQRSSH